MRARIRLTDAEVAAYLDAPRTMVVATSGPRGYPHQAPVFYVLDGGRPVFWTYRASQKVRNIERDARVSCLVEDGREHHELRGVLLLGTASISTDPGLIEATWRRLTTKYYGTLDVAVLERQAAKRCVVTVEVEHTASWDHRKLAVGG